MLESVKYVLSQYSMQVFFTGSFYVQEYRILSTLLKHQRIEWRPQITSTEDLIRAHQSDWYTQCQSKTRGLCVISACSQYRPDPISGRLSVSLVGDSSLQLHTTVEAAAASAEASRRTSWKPSNLSCLSSLGHSYSRTSCSRTRSFSCCGGRATKALLLHRPHRGLL